MYLLWDGEVIPVSVVNGRIQSEDRIFLIAKRSRLVDDNRGRRIVAARDCVVQACLDTWGVSPVRNNRRDRASTLSRHSACYALRAAGLTLESIRLLLGLRTRWKGAKYFRQRAYAEGFGDWLDRLAEDARRAYETVPGV